MIRVVEKNSLILAGNVCVGYQIAALLQSVGWRTRVLVGPDGMAELKRSREINAVIADIESGGIGGLEVLAWCRNNRPSIMTYAACSQRESALRERADHLDCKGFFYWREDRLQVDTDHGMAQLLRDIISVQNSLKEALIFGRSQ